MNFRKIRSHPDVRQKISSAPIKLLHVRPYVSPCFNFNYDYDLINSDINMYERFIEQARCFRRWRNLGYGACSSAVTTWESKLHLHSREIEPDVVRAFECPSEMAYRFTLSVANIFSTLARGEITWVYEVKIRRNYKRHRVVSHFTKANREYICASRRHQASWTMQTQLLAELGRYCEERIINRYVPIEVPKLSFISCDVYLITHTIHPYYHQYFNFYRF